MGTWVPTDPTFPPPLTWIQLRLSGGFRCGEGSRGSWWEARFYPTVRVWRWILGVLFGSYARNGCEVGRSVVVLEPGGIFRRRRLWRWRGLGVLRRAISFLGWFFRRKVSVRSRVLLTTNLAAIGSGNSLRCKPVESNRSVQGSENCNGVCKCLDLHIFN